MDSEKQRLHIEGAMHTALLVDLARGLVIVDGSAQATEPRAGPFLTAPEEHSVSLQYRLMAQTGYPWLVDLQLSLGFYAATQLPRCCREGGGAPDCGNDFLPSTLKC